MPQVQTTNGRPNPSASTTPILDFYFVVLFLAWDLKTLPSNPVEILGGGVLSPLSQFHTLPGPRLNCLINVWVFPAISGRWIITVSYKQNLEN